MSETHSSGQMSAGASEIDKDERLRLSLVVGGILLALVLAVVILRFHRLSEVPPGLYSDEGAHGVDALQVLRGEHAIFFPPRSPEGSDGREAMVVYAIAPFVSMFGRTMLALRLPTALASSASVFVVFWLGWMLFGRDEDGLSIPWRGLVIGGVGAGLLVVSANQTIIGRMAFRANYLPLILSLCLAFLWWGWKQRILWKIALAGLFAGLLHYTYVAARISPLLFLFLGLRSMPDLFRTEEVGKKDQSRLSLLFSRLRPDLTLIGTFAGVSLLVAAPLYFYLALHPQDFSTRIDQVWLFRDGPQNYLVALLVNLWDHLLVFGFRGDPAWRRNFASQPMLNPVEAVFFWSGVGISVWRWKLCSACRLLLLWLAVLFIPAVLARDIVPHTIRMIGASPAIYLLVSFGIWEVSQLVWNRLRELEVPQWQMLSKSGVRAPFVMGFLLCAMVMIQGVTTYRTYFQAWANAPDLTREYEVEWTDLTKFLTEQPPRADTVFLVPDGQRHLQLQEGYRSYIFDYLYKGAAPVHLFHTAMPNLSQKIHSKLAAMEHLSEVKVVEWNLIDVWSGDENDRFAFLLDKYGLYLGSEDHGNFLIHSYTDILLDRPWKFYDRLEPLNVSYDGGIELLGFALEYGAEKLPNQNLFNLGESRTLWVVLQWQTAPELATDYAISLRLQDSEGLAVYQQDGVLWKPRHAHTGSMGPSEQFDTLFNLELPAELPHGDYELRLVVYDTKSLKPTVELGVWKPEVSLTRLRLAFDQ